MYQQRTFLSGVFETHPGAISDNQYFRVLAIGCLDILITLPLGVFSSITPIIQGSIIPFYPGWAITHSLGDTAVLFSSDDWKSNPSTVAALVFGQWNTFFLAFVIFALFGLSETSVTFYRNTFQMIAWRLRIKSSAANGGEKRRSSGASLMGSEHRFRGILRRPLLYS